MLTLAAYTHFGHRSLKGLAMYYAAREVHERGQLRKVIALSKSRCQYDFDLRCVDTPPGESRVISALGEVKLRIWKGFPARWLGEMIFDHYAASRLTQPGGVLIATPRLPRTAGRAKALGCCTVLYGGSFHPSDLWAECQKEIDAFDLKRVGANRSRSWELKRFSDHIDRSDYIIAVSEFVKQSYVKRGFPSERIFVTPLGVDFAQFRPAAPPSEGVLTFLFLSHVNGAGGLLKGLHYLLRAWAELSLENAKLVVSGQIGREGKTLVRQFEGRLRNVVFTGPVADPARAYREASVFVFPCLAGTPGKVNLEAMAVGRPVIDVLSPSPLVRDGLDGFTVAPRDVEALKQRIRYFYDHPDEVARMGSNARERVKHLTWDRFSHQIADIVTELSGGERLAASAISDGGASG